MRVTLLASFANVPGFLPGVALAAAVAILARRRVAGWLGTGQPLAIAAVLAVGAILAATLTPFHDPTGISHLRTGCDFSRVGFATLDDITGYGDIGLNILMFVPLGVVLGLLPRSARTLGLIGLGALLPVGIELLQLLIQPLDRACQSRDVFDNVTGLALGLLLGFALAVVRAVVGAAARALGGDDDPGRDQAVGRR